MQIDYPVALGILASYFVLIFFLLWRIYPQLKHAITQGSKSIFGFLILSVISLGFTWFYMFAFFRHSYLEWKIDDQSEMELSLNSLSHWLNDVSLFDSAWRTVNVGDWPWLWSHQICSFTVAVWTPILAIEGSRRKIPHVWAYMLLGQVVAISVASALFFMVMLSVPISGTVSPTKISTLLVTSVLGIITVLISPFVATGEYFMLNLLVMHALLIFPLFNAKSPSNNPASVPIRSVAYIAILYSLAAGTNISIYIDRWLICLSNMSDMKEAISTLFSIVFQHPAQSSISFDIMCINLISIVWMINDGYRKKGRLSYQSLLSALSTPLFSASATLPFYFAISEIQNLASGSLKKD